MTIKSDFEALGGEIVGEYDASQDRLDHEPGDIRIVEHVDDMCQLEDLEGDMFNPAVNPEIDPEELEAQRNAFIDRCNRDGVWGYVAQVYDGQTWETTDSIWGFIGADFVGSGYDDDLMRSCVDGRQEMVRRIVRAFC